MAGTASALFLLPAVGANAQVVSLGAAGNFAVLETGNQNVSLAAAPPSGYINGNLGVAGGNLSDSGVPIHGNAYIASAASGASSLTGNVTGTINQNYNLSAAITAAANAATAASALTTDTGGGVGYTSINASGGNLYLTPGIYNLSDFTLGNGENVYLAAGGSYLFNISGTMSLNSADVIAETGLATANILFNVESTQAVGFSGGLNNECVLDGILLAENAQVHLTPGAVNGEIISGQSINIASGGDVNGITGVPEPATTGAIQALCMLAILGINFVRKPVWQFLTKKV